MTHAEYIELDGIAWSWYCTECGRELGADLDEKDGEPVDGCPEHGKDSIAWCEWGDFELIDGVMLVDGERVRE